MIVVANKPVRFIDYAPVRINKWRARSA
ncbi:hypothetical protein SPHINGO8AM_180167 [Sphingomonas sp. 8AM]|nr:hypothetical protein SPHINGO8AM_180167 [Sphingomonas sp. 8AM]